MSTDAKMSHVAAPANRRGATSPTLEEEDLASKFVEIIQDRRGHLCTVFRSNSSAVVGLAEVRGRGWMKVAYYYGNAESLVHDRIHDQESHERER